MFVCVVITYKEKMTDGSIESAVLVFFGGCEERLALVDEVSAAAAGHGW